ncbi:MAG: DUF3943 domain-containing protein [Candidatus Dadabacteria bacterium]|nr:DUF3943 domain-containing protein [Candidatus Dadabacteria bacterium]
MSLIRRLLIVLLAALFPIQAAIADQVEIRDIFDYAFSGTASLETPADGGAAEGDYDDYKGAVPPDGDTGGTQKLGVSAFLRDTALSYTFVWAARFFYVRNKNSRIFHTSLSGWWENISQWPEWPDGDSFVTNWVTHPVIGSQQYLYYRAMGHDFWTSALGSMVQNVLWEYTVEGLVQPPSLEDLVSTTFVGVPVGVLLEESSDWLVSTDFVPAKILGHVLNPMRNFVHDRQIGIYNPLSGSFMTLSGPIDFLPAGDIAIDLAYPMYLEGPMPIGRFELDLEIVNLEGNLGGELVFYSARVDVPSKSQLWGIYVAIAQSGFNSLSVDGERVKDGFEFANMKAGGKAVLYKTAGSVLSGGLELIIPTSYKDNLGRLETLLLFRRNFPVNLQKAWTAAPYLSAAAWKGPFSIQATVSSGFIANAGELEGNGLEYRVDYGAAAGVNIPVAASPVVFAELDGFSVPTAKTFKKNGLYASSGIRFGRRVSPGFAVQMPLYGPDKKIDRFSYKFDLQVRF